MVKLILMSFIGLCCLAAGAQAVETYHFASKQQQEQFRSVTQELRCLVCQNETIADSNAPLARDLRSQVYQKILAGEDKTAIIHYLVERYGQFILFKPAFNSATWVLWLFPVIFILLGFIFVLHLIRRAKARIPSPPPER